MICSTLCRFFMGSTDFTPQNSHSTLSSFSGLDQDSDFYQQVLGLQSSWRVEQVKLDQAAQRVVHVGVEPGTKRGNPAARGAAHVHQWEQRARRHLDTCQFETVISARAPSVKHTDGRVKDMTVPCGSSSATDSLKSHAAG